MVPALYERLHAPCDARRSAALERVASERSASTSGCEQAKHEQLQLMKEAFTNMQLTADERRPRPGRQLMSVAPMMDWTDVYFRQLARLLSRRTWLYTEMVVVSSFRRPAPVEFTCRHKVRGVAP